MADQVADAGPQLLGRGAVPEASAHHHPGGSHAGDVRVDGRIGRDIDFRRRQPGLCDQPHQPRAGGALRRRRQTGGARGAGERRPHHGEHGEGDAAAQRGRPQAGQAPDQGIDGRRRQGADQAEHRRLAQRARERGGLGAGADAVHQGQGCEGQADQPCQGGGAGRVRHPAGPAGGPHTALDARQQPRPGHRPCGEHHRGDGDGEQQLVPDGVGRCGGQGAGGQPLQIGGSGGGRIDHHHGRAGAPGAPRGRLAANLRVVTTKGWASWPSTSSGTPSAP